jgi:pimeloyl-ACP methyl ester carboxylesterase
MSLQVEIIHQIISGLRAGTIGGGVLGKKFDKVIYAGHSYGSICGNALAATYPADVDTYILTGYTGEFALGLVPLASGIAIPVQLVMPWFSDLPVGYLAQSVEQGRVYGLYTVDGVGGTYQQLSRDLEHTLTFTQDTTPQSPKQTSTTKAQSLWAN